MVKKGKLDGWPSGTGPLLRIVPIETPRSPDEATMARSVDQLTGLVVSLAGDGLA